MSCWLAFLLGCITAEDIDRRADPDGDGFDASEDCDEGDADRHPGAMERCNGADDDCDGLVDEEGAFGEIPGFLDADHDGWGAESAQGCDGRVGFSRTEGDCDDEAPLVHPEAEERCGNHVDDDCDPETRCEASGELDASGAGDFYPLWAPGISASACDTDGDGRDELVIGSASGSLEAWFWNDEAPGRERLQTGLGPIASIHCGDLDGDSAQDLVLHVSAVPQTVAVLWGSTSTRFADRSTRPLSFDAFEVQPGAQLTIDFDEHGDGPGVLLATRSVEGPAWLRWAELGPDLSTPATPDAFHARLPAGDVSALGARDLLGVGTHQLLLVPSAPSGPELFRVADAGAYETNTTLAASRPVVTPFTGTQARFPSRGGDVDGDGLNDLVALLARPTSPPQHEVVFASAPLPSGAQISESDWPRVVLPDFGSVDELALPDLNVDGRADLVALTWSGDAALLRVAYAPSPGQLADWTVQATIAFDDASGAGGALVHGDFDGDGFSDLAAIVPSSTPRAWVRFAEGY